jgi:hypothetical protein
VVGADLQGEQTTLSRASMAQVTNPSDVRRVTRLLRLFDCFVLGLEGLKDMIRMVFNNVVLDRTAFRSSLRSRLDKDARHFCLPPLLLLLSQSGDVGRLSARFVRTITF